MSSVNEEEVRREAIAAIIVSLEACLDQLDAAGLAIPAIFVNDALEDCRLVLAELSGTPGPSRGNPSSAIVQPIRPR